MTASKLTHDTIGNLQAGAIGYAIDRAIGEAMHDCERRPGLDKPRTVTIKLTLKPAQVKGLDNAASDTLNTIGIAAQVAVSTPARSAGAEFLNVSPGVNEDGEPEIHAVFAQEGLFVTRKEGN
ncbi:hypothetical protein [Deinococcus marmoris]|uniref:hypothetical protein n=1 Tax=Deinococcus marmoris TaxID=249408 RepID=UPI000495F4C2|nr:hypothetical protein [Deinococcus marmoris]